jgi:hypothetical protein
LKNTGKMLVGEERKKRLDEVKGKLFSLGDNSTNNIMIPNPGTNFRKEHQISSTNNLSTEGFSPMTKLNPTHVRHSSKTLYLMYLTDSNALLMGTSDNSKLPLTAGQNSSKSILEEGSDVQIWEKLKKGGSTNLFEVFDQKKQEQANNPYPKY